MKPLSIKNIFLFSIALLSIFTSCVDDDIAKPDSGTLGSEWNEDESNCLQVVISLDDMGGVSAASSSRAGDIENLREVENYVDTEKLRILFFTCVDKDESIDGDYDHDYFLFEPKNHWVKKIGADDNHPNQNRWLVSIPMYTHGNNSGTYNWDWEFIHERLTTAPFKIAILANRPEYDYVDQFSGNSNTTVAIEAGWMPNKGPYWSTIDAFSPGDEDKSPEELKGRVKDVFDLHHCQTDINYINKSTADGYYSFVMGDWYDDYNGNWGNAYDAAASAGIQGILDNKGPKMGATASWVDWEYFKLDENGNKIYTTYTSNSKEVISYCQNENELLNTSNAYAKRFRLPSFDYPIPMYGIQRFEPITTDREDFELWPEGSPFYLSEGIPGQDPLEDAVYDQKTISILRSVVKMELLIPKSYESDLNMVGMCYTNIYSRSEPINVWTPTDSLWAEIHTQNPDGSYTGGGKCEIDRILDYGSICKDNAGTGVTNYQKALSWYYGAWKEKGWEFKPLGKNNVIGNSPKYPNIFNPAIQRNQLVICDSNSRFDDESDYIHYIIYCGEKNITDPSSLNTMEGGGSNIMCQYWLVQIGTKVYGIPVTDYSKTSNPIHNVTALEASTGTKAHQTKDGLWYLSNHQHATAATGNGGYDSNNNRIYTMMDYYTLQVKANPTATDKIPWPLIRNHVYKTTLSRKGSGGSASGRSVSDQPDSAFSVKCEDFYSKSL